jgi:hypothetical protein
MPSQAMYRCAYRSSVLKSQQNFVVITKKKSIGSGDENRHRRLVLTAVSFTLLNDMRRSE